MRKMSVEATRTINGGGSRYCDMCGKTFKDKKFLGFLWVISSGEGQYQAHYMKCFYKHH